LEEIRKKCQKSIKNAATEIHKKKQPGKAGKLKMESFNPVFRALL
jgi:hypothetical protein